MQSTRFSRWIRLGVAASVAVASVPSFATDPTETPPDAATAPIDAAGRQPEAAAKFWEALRLLETRDESGQARGRALLRAAAEAEFAPAQVALAENLWTGSHGFDRNADEAIALYQLAAEQGDGFAMVGLGRCYFDSRGLRSARARAREWLNRSLAAETEFKLPPRPAEPAPAGGDEADAAVAGALQHDPVAHTRAQAHHLLGVLAGETRRPADALRHFLAAAHAGPAGRDGVYEAALAAALLYALGEGAPRDPLKANEQLAHARTLMNRTGARMIRASAAAKAVDEFAVEEVEEEFASRYDQIQSGLQYAIATTFGDKGSKLYDPAAAAKWYAVAAESDAPWAHFELALLESRGASGPARPEVAFRHLEQAAGDDEKPRHTLAAANLALCLARGYGAPADPARARKILGKLSDLEFVAYLGATGQAPDRLVDAAEALELHETWARDKYDAHAQYLWGLRYLAGYGKPADPKEARAWIKRAADAGDGPACAVIGRMLLGERDGRALAAEFFRRGVEAGNPASCEALAWMHAEGRLPFPDLPEAVRLLERAITLAPDRPEPYDQLARLLLTRPALHTGDPATEQARIDGLLARADELGSADAALSRGRQALGSRAGRGPDFRAAYFCFERAADRGSIAAHFELGRLHERGRGVPATWAEAARHYRRAAAGDHPGAMLRLGQLYLTGLGVPRDPARAARTLERLAEHPFNDARGLLRLGDDDSRRGDHAAALARWRQLIANRHASVAAAGHERLARCYTEGLGVPVDAAAAEHHRKLALEARDPDAWHRESLRLLEAGQVRAGLDALARAAEGSPAAAYRLGRMYLAGTNVGRDPARGWALVLRAAEEDDAGAQVFVASATAKRMTGAPSLAEALALVRAAEAAGHAQAATIRAQLERHESAPLGEPEEQSTAARRT